MPDEALQVGAAAGGAAGLPSFPAGSPPPLPGFAFPAGLMLPHPFPAYPLTPSMGSGESVLLPPLPPLAPLPQSTTTTAASLPNNHTTAAKKQSKKKSSAKSSTKKKSSKSKASPQSVETEELDPTDEYQRFLQQFSESAAAPATPAAGAGRYASAYNGTAAASGKGLDEYVPDSAPAPVRFERRKDLVVSTREFTYITQPDAAPATASATATATAAPARPAASASSSSSAAARPARSKSKRKRLPPNPAVIAPTGNTTGTSFVSFCCVCVLCRSMCFVCCGRMSSR
jgi:hypothetical protein